MKVLIVGSSGFVGSALAARLAALGHQVRGVSRRPPATAAAIEHRALDIARATHPDHWLPVLEGIDAVAYCAGALQDGPQDSLRAVHSDGPAALYRACLQAGVRRVFHLSAIGVDRPDPSSFSATKLAGDCALSGLDLDWVILRPSVVLGRAAWGASALMRGLAALPVRPSMAHAAPLQPVHLDDLLDIVVFFLRPEAPARLAVEVVGPRAVDFDALVSFFRGWLGWPPARLWRLPEPVSSLAYRLGDWAGVLGWRPAMRSNAGREMARAMPGSGDALQAQAGIVPRDPLAVFAAEPASIQERWFARLFFVRPLMIVALAGFWIVTGLVALGPGWPYGMRLMNEGEVQGWQAAATIVAGALSDIAVGALIAFRRSHRLGLWAGLALTATYAAIGSILVPHLWLDPLGPFLKVVPIMALHAGILAAAGER